MAKKDSQEKLLRNFLIGFGIVIAILIIGYLAFNSSIHQTYKNLEFEAVDEGGLIFYKTIFPVYYGDKKVSEYNFFFRTQPNDLKKIPFNGSVSLMELTVINGNDEELSCGGKGKIAIANFIHVHNFLEMEVYRDENASCDSEKRYAYVNFIAGEENKIEQYGPACFNIYFKDCEILPATERYMLDILSKGKDLVTP